MRIASFLGLIPMTAAGLVLGGVGAVSAADITGAGATFPAPVYAKWAEAYKAQTDNTLNYQAIGSGGGVRQINAKTVDFGASDDPMSGADLEKSGLVQFPAIIGGVVPVINVPGVEPGAMKLSGATLAKMFTGSIKQWDDAAIKAENPDLKLPATAITPVYRSDSSGTTAVFTDYLATVSPEFKDKIGAGKTVNWPAGVGGRGNAGVAANVSKIGGALGYVEYAYAKQNKLAHSALVNASGQTVQPDGKTFAAAAEGTDWSAAPGFGVSLNNQKGDQAWPITSASFILMHSKAANPTQSSEALKFFDWAFSNGQQMALDLDYVPLPEKTVGLVREYWKNIQDEAGKPVFTK